MKRIFTLWVVLFLCSTGSYAQDCTIGTAFGSTCVLTVDGNLTIPAGGDLTIEVKAWGAGGGSQSAKNKRSGGGGGAYFTATYTVSGGSVFPITVGQGSVANAGGDTSFDFDGGGLNVVGGGGLGTTTPGLGGTGTGSIPGGNGGSRETGGGNLDSGGGGGGSGPGNGSGGTGGDPTNGIGGMAGMAGSTGASGGAGGNDALIGSTAGENGAFPGGGAGGKGSTAVVAGGAAGGNGQVIIRILSALPVRLIAFDGKAKDNLVSLEWRTAFEVNNLGFEIERSTDGLEWELVEFVEGKGTAFNLNTYTARDKSPSYGLNYYRLKQIDFDRTSVYSKVIYVDFRKQNKIIAFPNPVDDQLIIETTETKEVDIRIFNDMGKVVYQKTQLMNEKLELDVSIIQSGNHLLHITDAKNGEIIYHGYMLKINK